MHLEASTKPHVDKINSLIFNKYGLYNGLPKFQERLENCLGPLGFKQLLRWMYPFPWPIHVRVLWLHPFQILSHLFVHMLGTIPKGAINETAWFGLTPKNFERLGLGRWLF